MTDIKTRIRMMSGERWSVKETFVDIQLLFDVIEPADMGFLAVTGKPSYRDHLEDTWPLLLKIDQIESMVSVVNEL